MSLRVAACTAVLLLAAGTAVAGKDTRAHGADAAHEHHHAAAHGATLRLNDGARWQTDASLRDGMEAFQSTLGAAIPAIHEGTFTPGQYTELAGKLEKQLASIMSGCKLAPAADAQFHLLLVEFFGGIETMKAEGDRMQGAVRIVRGLGAYGRFFDHPGWKALEHH